MAEPETQEVERLKTLLFNSREAIDGLMSVLMVESPTAASVHDIDILRERKRAEADELRVLEAEGTLSVGDRFRLRALQLVSSSDTKNHAAATFSAGPASGEGPTAAQRAAKVECAMRLGMGVLDELDGMMPYGAWPESAP